MEYAPSTPDVVTLGETLMLFSSPPVTRLLDGGAIRASFVGAESNLAIGLARLGHSVRWLSIVGDDLFGRHIVKALRGEGVDVSQVISSSAGPTATLIKSRRPAAEPEVFYYRSTSAFSKATAQSFAPEAWRSAKIIYLTGITPALGSGCRELVQTIIADARARGTQVWFDPNYRRKLWSVELYRSTLTPLLKSVDVILAGQEEGQILTEQSSPQPMAAALGEMGPRTVVIKAGAEGAYCHRAGQMHFCPAFPIAHLIDPIGAGDAFATGFLSGMLDALPIDQCLQRAHALGAIVCQTDGDWEGLPTRAELGDYLARRTESRR